MWGCKLFRYIYIQPVLKFIVTGVFWTNILVLKNHYTFMSLDPQFHFFPSWNAETLRTQIVQMYLHINNKLNTVLIRLPCHPTKFNLSKWITRPLYAVKITRVIKNITNTKTAFNFIFLHILNHYLECLRLLYQDLTSFIVYPK